MIVRLLSLVLVFIIVAAPEDSFARGGRRFVLENFTPDDKNLASEDGLQNWTEANVKMFCEGRKRTLHQGETQCLYKYKKEVGHKMTPGELQELHVFQAQNAARGEKAPAGKGSKKPAVKAEQKASKGKRITPDGTVDSTIVQPPLPD